MKIKSVVIPTDFSDNAFNAARYAISMFEGENPVYILLNAYRIIPVGAEDFHTDLTDFEGMSKEGLKRLAEKLTQSFPHRRLKLEIISRLGYPVETIDKVVKRKKADLVVMGTRGASGIREVLIGSNTADAIKTLTCPVLAIPENAIFSKPANIAFAADFKSIEKEVVLEPLIEIAGKFKSEILVIHVSHNHSLVNVEEAVQGMRLHEIFKNLPHLFQEVQELDPVSGIENFIDSHTVEMLVLLARKHSFWEKLFKPSVTGKLAMHTRIPLLALQYK